MSLLAQNTVSNGGVKIVCPFIYLCSYSSSRQVNLNKRLAALIWNPDAACSALVSFFIFAKFKYGPISFLINSQAGPKSIQQIN